MNTVTPEFYIAKKTNGNKIESGQIKESLDIVNFLRKTFNKETIEVNETFIAMFLNRHNDIIGWTMVSSGGVSATIVDTRMIMKVAIDCMASNIVLAHNHPSGNTKPSEPDKQITKKIQTAAKYFDMEVLDHIIITADSHYSFANEGLI